MYYRCGRGIVPPGGIRVAEIQKKRSIKANTSTDLICCARDESRTHTSQLTLAPETSASTISPPAQQIGMQIYEFFLNFQWYYSNPNILMKYLSQVPWQSVCQCYQIPIRSLLTCTHHWGISYPRLSKNSLRDRNTPYSYKAESVFFILTENILLLTQPLTQLRGSTLSLVKQKTSDGEKRTNRS